MLVLLFRDERVLIFCYFANNIVSFCLVSQVDNKQSLLVAQFDETLEDDDIPFDGW